MLLARATRIRRKKVRNSSATIFMYIANSVFLRTGEWLFIIFINFRHLLFLLTAHSIATIKRGRPKTRQEQVWWHTRVGNNISNNGHPELLQCAHFFVYLFCSFPARTNSKGSVWFVSPETSDSNSKSDNYNDEGSNQGQEAQPFSDYRRNEWCWKFSESISGFEEESSRLINELELAW